MIVLELYDVKRRVADIKHLNRTVREALGGRVIMSLAIPAGGRARIAVIRDDEIELDVIGELSKAGIAASLVLRSPVLGLSESPEFVRELRYAYLRAGLGGVAALVGSMSEDEIIEKVGHVLPLSDVEALREAAPKSPEPGDPVPKEYIVRMDGSREPYDPDKLLERLVRSGIDVRLAKRVLEYVESLVEGDFVVEYELDRAIKRTLSELGDHRDVILYEGFKDFSSRVFIDGKPATTAAILEIVRARLSKFGLEPSATLLRQLMSYVSDLLRRLASDTSATINMPADRLADTAETILRSEMPYISSPKPAAEALRAARAELELAKHALSVDRYEAIKRLERALEHALRALILSSGLIPPIGIRGAFVLASERINKALEKRLKLIVDLRRPENRYNKRLVNTFVDALEELLGSIKYERGPEDTLPEVRRPGSGELPRVPVLRSRAREDPRRGRGGPLAKGAA